MITARSLQMKSLDIDSLILSRGAHTASSQELCVMEAVAFVAGEPWSDSPECASPVISSFLRSYNDAVEDDTRQTLKQYIPRLIGTRGSKDMESRRATIAADWLVRKYTPAWLRCAGLIAEADALASLPEIVSFVANPSIKAPLEAAVNRASAALDGVEDEAGDETWIAARDVARDVALIATVNAALSAAGYAALSAAGQGAGNETGNETGDEAWDVAWDAAGNAAGYAAQSTALYAVRSATGDDQSAARSALQPTVDELQATVSDLIERMLAAREAA